MSSENSRPVVLPNITEIGGRPISGFSSNGVSVSFENQKSKIDAELAQMQLDAIKKGIQVRHQVSGGPVQ